MKITRAKRKLADDESKGKNILEITLPGEIIEIVGADEYHYMDIGNLLLRTNSEKEPFVGLSDGHLWGLCIDSYTFKRIDNYEFIVK